MMPSSISPCDQVTFYPPCVEMAPLWADVHERCFSQPWSVEVFARFFQSPTTIGWLALDEEKGGVGVLMCACSGQEADILTFGVIPEWRRHGFGKMLVLRLLTYAKTREISNLYLEVSLGNQAAIALYEGIGFWEVGRRKDYYQAPGLCDVSREAVVMKWGAR